MRIVALLRASAIDLRHVETIVLDEADKLFELDSHLPPADAEEQSSGAGGGGGAEEEDGNEINTRSSFLSQVDEIIAACSQGVITPSASPNHSLPKKKNKKQDVPLKQEDEDNEDKEEEEVSLPSTGKHLQRALFSATIGPFIQELADSFLQNPIRVVIGQENSGAPSIRQKLIFAGREDGKILALRNLILEGKLTPPVLLFTQSIERSKQLYRELAFDGLNVEVMHSDRTSTQREGIINRFRIGEIWVLICTDLMARGIDFKAVKMILNYDLPQSAVSYIHRIGRTGRGGRQGEAITFFTEDDIPNMRSIVNVMKLSGCEVPEWLLTVKQVHTLSLCLFSLSLTLTFTLFSCQRETRGSFVSQLQSADQSTAG
jgi:superfamily II DNA/RNA helicase